MRIYIAGPMRGYPDHNFPAFDAARDYLLAMGHEPISPADMDRDRGYADPSQEFSRADWHRAMREDIVTLLEVDAIALLPGWQKSEGAKVEQRVAHALGLLVMELERHGFKDAQ